MADQDLPTDTAQSPLDLLKQKTAQVHAVIAKNAVGLGAESSWIPEVLHFILGVIPELIELFEKKPAAGTSAATTPLPVEGGH